MNEATNKLLDLIREALPELTIVIAEGYDFIETPNGQRGFGVYDVVNNTIYVAGNMPDPEYDIPFTILHELYHVYQKREGLRVSERKADRFAKEFCNVLGLNRS